LVAGAAASQSAAAWRRAGRRPHQIVAGLTGLLMPLAAAVGTASLGAVAVLAVGAALAGAATDRRRHSSVLADAGLTLRCGFVVGLACSSLVIIHRLEIGAAICLVLLMCAYDVGDFLVGTGASTPAEGPIAGIAAVLVVTFAIGVFAFPPFDWRHGCGHVPARTGAGHGHAPDRGVAGALVATGRHAAPGRAALGVGPLGIPHVNPATLSLLPHRQHRGHDACR